MPNYVCNFVSQDAESQHDTNVPWEPETTILSGTVDPANAFCDTGGKQVYTTLAKRRVAVRFSRPGTAEKTSLVHVVCLSVCVCLCESLQAIDVSLACFVL
jgi:hypothetical protein